MSFFPAGFDASGDSVGLMGLVNINTADGDYGFLPGIDGKFTDLNGKVWWGSVLIGSPAVPMSIDGVAPAGEIGMTFFQDPAMPDLIAQIRELGSDYVRGRALTFFVQPLGAMAQLYAPVFPPIQMATFEMRSIAVEKVGPMQRRIILKYEGIFAGRNEARGWYYSTADHAKLLGAANPSLSLMPTEYRPEEKLF